MLTRTLLALKPPARTFLDLGNVRFKHSSFLDCQSCLAHLVEKTLGLGRLLRELVRGFYSDFTLFLLVAHSHSGAVVRVFANRAAHREFLLIVGVYQSKVNAVSQQHSVQKLSVLQMLDILEDV